MEGKCKNHVGIGYEKGKRVVMKAGRIRFFENTKLILLFWVNVFGEYEQDVNVINASH